jgi:lysophospholipase L1-like esterase
MFYNSITNLLKVLPFLLAMITDSFAMNRAIKAEHLLAEGFYSGQKANAILCGELPILSIGVIQSCRQVHTSISCAPERHTRIEPTVGSGRVLPGSLSDPHLRFIGRWNFDNLKEYVSFWGGAYVKVRFTGTCIKMMVGNKSDFFASIDGGPWMQFHDATDTITLNEKPLQNIMHTLVVAQGKDYDYLFRFRGFVLDAGAKTAEPEVSSRRIEYIGDSITAGYTDSKANVSAFSWIASELLIAEHTQIAFPGICLVDGVKNTGMSVQYNKLIGGKAGVGPHWKFSHEQPQAIVINLGTNDEANHVPDSMFRNAYVRFLTALRQRYSKTQIVVMRTFLGLKATPTQEAVDQRQQSGDHKVYFLDTNNWLKAVSTDYNDGAHPSDTGQLKAGRLLAEQLEKWLK